MSSQAGQRQKNGRKTIALIYRLEDPITDGVHYIGITKYKIRRYEQHIFNCSKNNLEKWSWINGLKKRGLLPRYVIQEDNVRWEERFRREKYWIDYHIDRGEPLTNKTGRKSPKYKSPEDKKKEIWHHRREELRRM